MSCPNSLQPHGLQHARLPCPSPSSWVCSNSCPSSQRSIQPYHPLPSPSPAPNPSQHQGLFQWVSSLIRWPKYWSFSFSIHPSNEYSGPISFRIGWFDLLAVQGTLKSLLQHHSSKSSILRLSALFTGGCSNWLLDGRHPFSILNSLGAYHLGGRNTMAWWWQHPLIPDMAGNILLTGWRKLERICKLGLTLSTLNWFGPFWAGLIWLDPIPYRFIRQRWVLAGLDQFLPFELT